VIAEADVLGDLYDLVGGTVAGRRSPTDITFFKNAGGCHLDLMTAELVLRRINT
jgi:ornithine cyclodeaminase